MRERNSKNITDGLNNFRKETNMFGIKKKEIVHDIEGNTLGTMVKVADTKLLIHAEDIEEEFEVAPEKSIAQMVEETVTQFELQLAEEDILEYEKASNDAGFLSPALVREKILLFQKKNGKRIYDWNAVNTFLHKMYYKPAPSNYESGQESQWFPINDKQPRVPDIGEYYNWGGDLVTRKAYKKEIPLKSLKLIKELNDFVSGVDLSYFVNDVVEIPKPDPFLCVAIDGMEPIVIDHWDEPDFK